MSERTETTDHELSKRIRGLEPLRPGPAFRERVRQQFLSTQPAAEPAPSLPAGRSWTGLVFGGVGLAAAAALLFALFLPSGGNGWTVTEVSGSGEVHLDGTRIEASRLIGERLDPESRISTGPGIELSLTCADEITLVISENAALQLGDRTGDGTIEALQVSLDRGTAWGTTGPDFPTGGLWMETPEARVHVSGTTFAVMKMPDSTCICVLEGTVQVDPLVGTDRRPLAVPPDQRLFVMPRDGGPILEPLPQSQHDRLSAVRSLVSPRG